MLVMVVVDCVVSLMVVDGVGVVITGAVIGCVVDMVDVCVVVDCVGVVVVGVVGTICVPDFTVTEEYPQESATFLPAAQPSVSIVVPETEAL